MRKGKMKPVVRREWLQLVVFDLDGVLVDVDSSWQAVHRAFKVDNEENYRKYLEGKIDYKEFTRLDVNLWGKVSAVQIKRVLDRLPLMEGASETVFALKDAGYRTAIISSGISLLVDRVRRQLDICRSFSNRLVIDSGGCLSGECEEAVALLGKVRFLKELAYLEGITPKECAAVGDSVYDIPLFKVAGFGIAFNAREYKVRDAADVVVEGKDLMAILPYLT